MTPAPTSVSGMYIESPESALPIVITVNRYTGHCYDVFINKDMRVGELQIDCLLS